MKVDVRKDMSISAISETEAFSNSLKKIIETSLLDDKAEDLVIINLSGKSSLADYMIIATGRSSRHVQSLAQNLEKELKKIKDISLKTEGMNEAEWVLIDTGDIIIHLFQKEIRDFYNLEKLWDIRTPKKIESVKS